MRHIVVRPESCTGCRLCQLTCSAQNFKLNTHKAAHIGIVPRFPEGYFISATSVVPASLYVRLKRFLSMQTEPM
jgi:Fe-S-cluster-containing hydrogenase component 2